MDPNDSMYEIATTDAWRNLIAVLEQMQKQFEKKVVTVCKQVDFKPTEATRYSGCVQAIESVLETLKELGAKKDA